MTIAVVTPAIPERAALLAECIASVNAQSYPPVGHYVGVDHAKVGCVTNLNRTVNAALASGADWIALLADDDLMYPHHLGTLIGATRTQHDCAGFGPEGPPCDSCPGDGCPILPPPDIVYSWCQVTGRPGWNPNRHFDAEALRYGNYIPATSLIRSSLIRELGGWRPGAHGFEDWDFWLRALDHGARFRCIPAVTWEYRFGHDNFSWRQPDGET